MAVRLLRLGGPAAPLYQWWVAVSLVLQAAHQKGQESRDDGAQFTARLRRVLKTHFGDTPEEHILRNTTPITPDLCILRNQS